MATRNIANSKYGPSDYKYVSRRTHADGFAQWVITLRGVSQKIYDTERAAALAVDKYLISKGKEPVNILKRKLP